MGNRGHPLTSSKQPCGWLSSMGYAAVLWRAEHIEAALAGDDKLPCWQHAEVGCCLMPLASACPAGTPISHGGRADLLGLLKFLQVPHIPQGEGRGDPSALTQQAASGYPLQAQLIALVACQL